MASYTGGDAAQSRIKELVEERQRQREVIERRREEIRASGADQAAKFAVRDAEPNDLKVEGGGLVTHSDLKALRIKRQRSEEKVSSAAAAAAGPPKRKALNRSKLSFAASDSEEEDEEEVSTKRRRRVVKNPDADTAFLPDRALDEEKRATRAALEDEWREEQARIKAELMTVTFSYWNGVGHRRVARVRKGTTIGKFLALAQAEFPAIRGVPTDALMYVKEDVIIPHHYSFYDFIVAKARGKSGPLFAFDATDDVRVVSDATKEKGDTHAGKVVERSWYERNRHIFPASRWTVYDPAQSYDTYTIR